MHEPLQIMNPLEHPAWDDEVARWPEASVFHSLGWARVLADSYGCRPLYPVCREGDQLRAVLPLMEVRGWLHGRRGVSLPFSDFCGALVDEPGHLPALMGAAHQLAVQHGWRSMEFRGTVDAERAPEPELSFHTHELDLQGSEERQWARCRPEVQRAIRKARAAGLEVRIRADDESLGDFYFLQTLTRRRHGLPPQPRSFFRALQQQLLKPGGGMIVTARQEGRAVAAALFLRFGARALFKYGACDLAAQAARPNDLVMWEGIRWCREVGCRSLSLGKTRLEQDGLRRFKLGWGAAEDRLDYYRYEMRTESFVKGSDPVAGWHNRVFRVLPVPLLQWAGRVLYREAA